MTISSDPSPERKYSASDISSVEDEALRRVDKTMKTIEDFLARWNASKISSGGVLPEVEKIKEFHTALAQWQRKAAMGRSGSDEERMERLEEVVLICRATFSG